MATIRLVAERAGVSLTTVSHVINNSRFVAPATRQRVIDAMNELNYRPNTLARSLRRGKTFTLGLLVPDSRNPFFAEVARAIEIAAADQKYSVILCNTENTPEREAFCVDLLTSKQVDGLIFVATSDLSESLSELSARQLPVVVVDCDLPEIPVDSVLTDHRTGGYQATRHLIEQGHNRIACIGGPSNGNPTALRVTGYEDALIEAGIAVDPNLMVTGSYRPESGLRAANQLLSLPDPPTAIFCCSDLMAFGAIHALNRNGLRVPDDVAIVGFDNIELADYTTPPLTSVAQPINEIGTVAASLVLARIHDRDREIQRPVLSTELVVRQSSVRPVSVVAD